MFLVFGGLDVTYHSVGFGVFFVFHFFSFSGPTLDGSTLVYSLLALWRSLFSWPTSPSVAKSVSVNIMVWTGNASLDCHVVYAPIVVAARPSHMDVITTKSPPIHQLLAPASAIFWLGLLMCIVCWLYYTPSLLCHLHFQILNLSWSMSGSWEISTHPTELY